MMHISEALSHALGGWLIEAYIGGVPQAGPALDALIGGDFPFTALADVVLASDPDDLADLRATMQRVLNGGPLYV